MKIIPVIDIKNHRAVHAVRGQRHRYRPVNSALCPQDEVAQVAAAYLDYYRFSTLYIADLDAITGNGENAAPVSDLLRRYPDLVLWLDAGCRDYPQQLHTAFPGRLKIVLGTETGLQPETCQALRRNFNCIISLDYQGDTLSGGQPLGALEPLLTEEIIVLSLHTVGTRNGPDWNRLRRLRKPGRPRKLYPAGGVRGKADLLRLYQERAAGALVASCLHNKTLSAAEIAELEALPPHNKPA